MPIAPLYARLKELDALPPISERFTPEKEERFRMDGTHLFKEFLAGIFHRGRDAADSELHRAL